MLSLDNVEKKKFKTIQATAENFVEAIIKDSTKKLVVVLFTVPSSKEMQLILEKVLAKSQDEVVLGIVDANKDKMLVQQLGVESVPTVLIFKDGKPLTGFAGMQSEENITKVFARLIKLDTSSKQSLDSALAAFKNSDFNLALSLYVEVLEQEPENIKAVVGAMHCYIFLGYLSDEIFENLTENLKKVPEIMKLEEAYKNLLSHKDGVYGKEVSALLQGTKISETLEYLLSELFNNKEVIKSIILSATSLMGNEYELSSRYLRKLTTLLYV